MDLYAWRPFWHDAALGTVCPCSSRWSPYQCSLPTRRIFIVHNQGISVLACIIFLLHRPCPFSTKAASQWLSMATFVSWKGWWQLSMLPPQYRRRLLALAKTVGKLGDINIVAGKESVYQYLYKFSYWWSASQLLHQPWIWPVLCMTSLMSSAIFRRRWTPRRLTTFIVSTSTSGILFRKLKVAFWTSTTQNTHTWAPLNIRGINVIFNICTSS